MITVNNVTKNFGQIAAVRGVSFTIAAGEVVGFLGPNGAGKSTTMRMIAGYLPPSSGSIHIAGVDQAQNPGRAKSKIGYLPESAALYTDMEVSDFLKFMGRMHGLTKDTLLTRLKFVVRECQLQSVLGRKIETLSKGFRQRVGLAQALLHDPDILILDEPTVGLDPNQIIEIRELIKNIGKVKTVLLSTHILPEVSATCQRVLIINQGKIVAEGTPESLTLGALQQSMYQVTVRGPQSAIAASLQSISGCVAVTLLKSAGDENSFALTFTGDNDASESIFHCVVAGGWSLSLLMRERKNLEDVFKQLTKAA